MRLNNRGQATVEYVLISIILVMAIAALTKAMRSNQALAQLVNGPWVQMAGMIENGVWGDPKSVRALHPGYNWRHLSLKGDAP